MPAMHPAGDPFPPQDADVVGAGFLALGKVPVEAVLSAPNGR
jgi:hypothetical protein